MHMLLNQRMCSYNHCRRKNRKFFAGKALLSCRHGTGQQYNRNIQSEISTELLVGFKVLPCQNLSRGHNCRLVAIMRTPCHGKECDNCFSGAHVSLNQTLHDVFSMQVFRHIRQCPLLRICQLVRQFVCLLSDKILILKGKGISFPLLLFFLVLHPHDKKKKFIENQTFSGSYQCVHGIRKMYLFHGIVIFAQSKVLPYSGRKKIRDQRARIKCLPDGFCYQVIGNPAGKRIDRIQLFCHLFIVFGLVNYGLFHDIFSFAGSCFSIEHIVLSVF